MIYKDRGRGKGSGSGSGRIAEYEDSGEGGGPRSGPRALCAPAPLGDVLLYPAIHVVAHLLQIQLHLRYTPGGVASV